MAALLSGFRTKQDGRSPCTWEKPCQGFDMLKIASLLVLCSLACFQVHAESISTEKPMSLHELTLKRLDGKTESLSEYKGKVVLVVNVASKCGFTKQYTGLQKLYTDYKDKGFVILGLPSNDFGGQEPGTEAEIATFCSTTYGVTFPMFEKVVTKAEGQSAIYTFLTQKEGLPKWNFHKYLVGKDGQVIASFPSKVTPDSKELLDAIEAALQK
jgi:glutathione peroxidase